MSIDDGRTSDFLLKGPEGAPPASSDALRATLRRQAAGVVALYAVAAGAWIALSDRLLGALVHDADTLVRVSVFKGFAFVLATTALLWLLLQRAVGVVERALDDLRRSEARHRATLDSVLEACQILDFDWRYLYLNHAAAVQNRRPNEGFLGRTIREAWPGIEGTAVFALLARCMAERAPQQGEVEFAFADGHTGWFDVRVLPVPEGVFLVSIDITERRRAEGALRELNQGLERKVAERTRDLDAARERAESADRIKSSFLATMSHELRTPLNSILGFTGIILRGMAGPLTDEQSKQLGMVQGSARHLLDLINDVLDISRIEAGQLEVRAAPFDLIASARRAAASVAPLADKKGLSLRVVAPEGVVTMESDQRRVEQVLLNLLNNALKFTDRGEVTLTVAVAGEPAAARIEVSDTGIGIGEEDLARLFQPFHQVDSGLQRRHEGTGLGLAICRRLTGLLGGTIHAESAPGRGSVFTVEIPLKRAPNP